MLQTSLKHVETSAQYKELIEGNDSVAIVCGRMGPMCLPVYDVMDNLTPKYPDVTFRDMDFDDPVSQQTIRALPEVREFAGLPFTMYYKNGKVVAATSSIQSKRQVKDILDRHLA
jgi:thioredoxin